MAWDLPLSFYDSQTLTVFLILTRQVIYCGDPARLSDCYDRVSQDKRGLEGNTIFDMS